MDERGVCLGCLHKKLKLSAWIAVELEVTITRQSQTGPPHQDGKASETPLVFDDNASEAAHILWETVHGWAACVRAFGFLRAERTGSTQVLATWMADNIAAVARVDDIDKCYTEIGHAIELGFKAIDTPTQTVYLGDCACGRRLYASPAEEYVACLRCGLTHRVDEYRAANQETGRNLYVTAAEAAQVLGEVYGIKVTRKRITMWHRRGKLDMVDGYYRLGDIIGIAEIAAAESVRSRSLPQPS